MAQAVARRLAAIETCLLELGSFHALQLGRSERRRRDLVLFVLFVLDLQLVGLQHLGFLDRLGSRLGFFGTAGQRAQEQESEQHGH